MDEDDILQECKAQNRKLIDLYVSSFSQVFQSYSSPAVGIVICVVNILSPVILFCQYYYYLCREMASTVS